MAFTKPTARRPWVTVHGTLRAVRNVVRTTARHSIHKRKRTIAPGEPPSSHTGLLRRFIFFGYDRERRSVVIGPARLN